MYLLESPLRELALPRNPLEIKGSPGTLQQQPTKKPNPREGIGLGNPAPKSERDVVAVIRGRRGLLRRRCRSCPPDGLKVADNRPPFAGFTALFSEVDGGESNVSKAVRAVPIRDQGQLQILRLVGVVYGVRLERNCDKRGAVFRGKQAGSSEFQQVNFQRLHGGVWQ